MKAKIEALNKSYLVEFKDEDQFVSFLTQHNDKINNVEIINEETLPELQKPVEVAKPSMSDGWKTLEKSAFTQKEKGVEKKGMTLGGKYVEFKYEPDKTLDNAADDKVSTPKSDSPALTGDEPKVADVEATAKEAEVEAPKTEAPKAEETKAEPAKEESPKAEEPKEETTEDKEELSEEDKEEKKEDIDESVDVDAEINEVLEAAGVQLDEGLFDALKSGFKKVSDTAKKAAIAGTIALAVLTGSATASAAEPEYRTEQIQIIDGNGEKQVAEFKIYEDGSAIDEYGNAFSESQLEDLKQGKDPYGV